MKKIVDLEKRPPRIYHWIFWITTGLVTALTVQVFFDQPMLKGFAGILVFLFFILIAILDISMTELIRKTLPKKKA